MTSTHSLHAFLDPPLTIAPSSIICINRSSNRKSDQIRALAALADKREALRYPGHESF